MGPVRKLLSGAAALLLTVALIYIGVQIFDRASRTSDSIEQNQAYTEQVTAEYGVTKYDGLDISGSTAITYIKQVVGVHGVAVSLSTTSPTTGATYSNSVIDSSHYSDFRDIGSEYYINPMAMFHVEVTRDANEVITEVSITQK